MKFIAFEVAGFCCINLLVSLEVNLVYNLVSCGLHLAVFFCISFLFFFKFSCLKELICDTVSCAYMVISCNLFSVHPFHACSYMYLNHVLLLLLLLLWLLFLFKGGGGSLKASFWHLLSLQAGSCVWFHLRACFGHSCVLHHWQPLMEKLWKPLYNEMALHDAERCLKKFLF